VNFDLLAQRFLPGPVYARVAGSSTAGRLARGSLWSLFGSATSRILVLLAMIPASHILGQASFGALGLVQATLGVFGLMTGAGLGGAATRFVAKYAKTDPARAGRVIGLVNASSVVTVLVSAGTLVTFSDVLAEHVLAAPHLQTALIWGGLLLAANAFRGIQNGTLAGLERFDSIAWLNILDGVLALPSIVLLAMVLGVKGALLGLALSAAIAWITGGFLLARNLRDRGIAVRYRGALADWRILSGYSLPGFLADSVATPVLWLAMTIVARTEDGFAQLGLYNAAYQWHGPLVFLPMILMGVSIPVLVTEWETGSVKRFRRIFLTVAALAAGVPLAAAVFLSLFSPSIMSFYGDEFRKGWLLLVILLFAAPFHAIAKVAFGALYGMNRPWAVLGVNLLWCAALITLTVVLLPGQGVLGLGVAFLVAYLVLALAGSAMVLKWSC